MKKFLCLTVMLAGVAAMAVTIDELVRPVDGWAESSPGASDGTVGMYIDFGNGNDAVFGYNWNWDGALDTIARPAGNGFSDDPVDAYLGEAMMLALDDQTGLDVNYSYHPTFGFFLQNLVSGGETLSDVSSYVGLWTSQDGSDWSYASVGVSSLDLSTANWLGFTAIPFTADFPPSSSLAPAAIPEPTSLALLGLAGLAVIRRRK
jgi:hypothetical protein